MKKDFIKNLRCGKCKSGMEVGFSSPHGPADSEEITFGTLKCSCGEYPIVYGILILREQYPLKDLISAIKNAGSVYELENITLSLIGEKFIRGLLKFSNFLKRYFKIDVHITFWTLTTFLNDSRWATYVKYRYSAPSLISGMSTIPLLKSAANEGDMILDVGSGFGHLAYLISRFFGKKNMCLIDRDFINLFFARKYFVGQKAVYVSLDGNEPLPFNDGIFPAVTSMDCFHYIEKKQFMADELKRVMKDNGVIVFSHLHNKYIRNISQGPSVTPEEYAGFFKGYEIRMFPEKYLVKSMFDGSPLDLTREIPLEEIKRSDSISLVATKNKSFLSKQKQYFSLEGEMRALNRIETNGDVLMLNPIYRKKWGAYKLVFPSAFYEEEYYLIKEFFLKEVERHTPVEDMKRKLVMIPLPHDFKRENAQSSIHLWR